MQAKSIFSSRTFWVNLITAVIAIVGTFSELAWVQDYPIILPITLSILAVANIVLRTITVEPVTLMGKKKT